MALRRQDAVRRERKLTKGGSPYYIYYFSCSVCEVEISSQHSYLPKHSGMCPSCVRKGPKFIAAYGQLLGNKHKRRVDVELTYEEFFRLCEIETCHYCYEPINRTVKRGEKGYRGYCLDRKDNDLSYTMDNCVPCCWRCNQTKGNRFTYEQFMKISEVIRSFGTVR